MKNFGVNGKDVLRYVSSVEVVEMPAYANAKLVMEQRDIETACFDCVLLGWSYSEYS